MDSVTVLQIMDLVHFLYRNIVLNDKKYLTQSNTLVRKSEFRLLMIKKIYNMDIKLTFTSSLCKRFCHEWTINIID